MNADSGDATDEETGGDGMGTWILLRMNRWALTGAILIAVFVVLVSLSRAGLAPFRTIVESNSGMGFLFSTFISTIVTGTAIVVTINQLVLSQELGAVGDQRERMRKSMEFREDIEAEMGTGASPTDPAAFLFDLAVAIEERANALDAAVDERDGTLRADVTDYADGLAADARSLQGSLEGAEFGTFDVIWSALNFNYSEKIYTGRHLRAEFGESLPEEAADALGETLRLLQFFAPVREHFKTLYFQWELIDLSRALLYVSVPALTAMGMLIMYVDGSALPGTTLGVDNLVWLASAGFVLGISPFAVFTAYVLRIATIAKRALAIGPFILQDAEREIEFEK